MICYLFSLRVLHLLYPLSTDKLCPKNQFYFLIGLVNCQSSYTIPPHKLPALLEINCPLFRHLPLLRSVVARMTSHILLNMALNSKDLPILGRGWEHSRQAPRESLTSVLCISSTTLCCEAACRTLTLWPASTSVIHKSQGRGVYMSE